MRLFVKCLDCHDVWPDGATSCQCGSLRHEFVGVGVDNGDGTVTVASSGSVTMRMGCIPASMTVDDDATVSVIDIEADP